MSVPNTIENGPGKFPDATKLQENFDYLDGLICGGTLKKDTLANLKTFAALNPTVAFIAVENVLNLAYIYMGTTLVGDGGFVIIGGGVI